MVMVMMIPRNSGVDTLASQPRFLQRGKTNTCEQCGDKGDLTRLIYCVQCWVSAEHSYCLEKLHKEDDGTISWKCEECSLKDAKCGLVQLRKSGRISQAIEAKYGRMKNQKESTAALKMKKSVVLDQVYMGKSSEADKSNYLKNHDFSNGNQDLRIKRRQLDLEDENIFYEGSELLKCSLNTPSEQLPLEPEKYIHTKSTNNTIDGSESFMLQGLLCPGCNKCSQVEPVSDPVWRGQFRMNNMTLLGLVAHLSSIACSKVHCTVTGLSPLLDVELLPRFDIWPRSFRISAPTEDNIGLYIFPQYESDEVVFDGVMNDLIEQNMALKAIITNNVELLIFSSRVLPPENRRKLERFCYCRLNAKEDTYSYQ